MRVPRTPPWVRGRRVARMAGHVAGSWLGTVLGAPLADHGARARAAERSARRALAALDVHVLLRGAAPVREGPVLLVANHVSWLDVQALSLIAGARFVAKAEVRDWPGVGRVAAHAGTFFLVRRSFRDAARVKDRVREALRAGERVAFFPEGTTTDGTRLGRFYPALFQAAVESGAPVQPVTIRYLDHAGTPTGAAAFVDDMIFLASLARIVREPRIHAELTFGTPIAAAGRTRRELAARTQAFVAATLGLAVPAGSPSTGEAPPRRRPARAA